MNSMENVLPVSRGLSKLVRDDSALGFLKTTLTG